MTQPRRGIGTIAIGIVVIAIILIAAVGVISLTSQPSKVATTSSSTTASEASSSSSSAGQTMTTSTSTSTQPTGGTEPSISSVLAANVTISGFPGEIAVNPNTNRIYLSDVFAERADDPGCVDPLRNGHDHPPGTAQSGLAVDTTSNTVYVPVAGCNKRAERIQQLRLRPRPRPDKGESSRLMARPTASSASITSMSERSRSTRARASSTESQRIPASVLKLRGSSLRSMGFRVRSSQTSHWVRVP